MLVFFLICVLETTYGILTGFHRLGETARCSAALGRAGGCHFAHVDGSCRFVQQDTDALVLVALTTREGRDEVPGDL